MRSTCKTWGYTAALAVALAASPALAQHGHHRSYDAGHAPGASFMVDSALAARCGFGAGSMRPAAYHGDYDHRRSDAGRTGRGIGGALIGGAVGGLLGNRIAGRGDRVIGSIAGAAVGAIAGAAIDRAEDRDRNYSDDNAGNWREDDWRDGDWRGEGSDYGSDECDSVLPAGYRLVSVPGGQDCRDETTTTEEWVPEYVTVPGRPTYRAPARDKRTKLRRVK